MEANRAILAGLVILGLGAFAFFSLWRRDDPAPQKETPTVEKTTASGVGAATDTPEAEPPEPLMTRAEAEALQRDLAAARGRIADLEEDTATGAAALDALRQENEKLQERLAPFLARERATIADVFERIEIMRKEGGASAFLSPGATADLIGDLKELGDAGVDAVLELLGSEDSESRFLAAKLLEDLSDPRTIPALTEAALNDEDQMVMRMSAHALALMGREEALGSLHKIVAECPDVGARVNSLFGLCKLGDADGVQKVVAFMQDPEQHDRLKMALGGGILLLRSEAVFPIVKEIATSVGTTEPSVMTMAIDYYKGVGTQACRNELQNIAANTALSQEIRDAALAALNG